MIKNTKNPKNLSFTFSPKAFLSVVPTVVPFGIQEFNFFRFSITFLTALENRRTILTFRVLLTRVKLFNSFLCKTTYSELLKELTMYYSELLSLYKRKILGELLMSLLRSALKSNSIITTRVGGFLRQNNKFFPSSKICSNCGGIKKDLTLKDRIYECSSCGLVIDRDYNAALNILREGLKILTKNCRDDRDSLLNIQMKLVCSS